MRRRPSGKSKIDPAVSVYFRELARRRNAGRTIEEMRARFYANGLDKYQFRKGQPRAAAKKKPEEKPAISAPLSYPCGHPCTEANTYWIDVNTSVCRQCRSSTSVPVLSMAERQQNRERWDEMNRQAEEIHLREEQERVRQSLDRARSVQPKPVGGIWIKSRS